MDLSYVTYKGEKHPLNINFYAIKHFQKTSGKPVYMMQDFTEDEEILLFHALEAGYHEIGKEMPFKLEDMEWVLNDCKKEFEKAVVEAFPPPEETKSGGDSKKK